MKQEGKYNLLTSFRAVFIAAVLATTPAFCADSTNTNATSTPPTASRPATKYSRTVRLPPAWTTNQATTGSQSPDRKAASRLNHVLDEIGPHHRSWMVAVADSASAAATPASGAAAQNRAGHHLVEIATGMNYWDGQQWTSSDPTFDITDNAYVAKPAPTQSPSGSQPQYGWCGDGGGRPQVRFSV